MAKIGKIGVSAVQEAIFAVIIIANVCSEHSLQALKGEHFAINYCWEIKHVHLTVDYQYHYSPLPKDNATGLADIPLHH